jgi:hypothetical protein
MLPMAHFQVAVAVAGIKMVIPEMALQVKLLLHGAVQHIA